MIRRSFLLAALAALAAVPARAMFAVSHHHGFNARRSEVSGTFLGHAVDTTDGTSYTFSSKDLGTAASDRLIVVGADASVNTPVVDTLTIGGVSASLVVAVAGQAATRCEFWAAIVPTGTTGDIVVTFTGAGGSIARCGIAWWRLTGASTTAHDTSSDNAGSSGVYATTLDIPASGFAVGIACNASAGAARTFTWSGLTEESGSDEVVESGHSHAAASDSFTLEQTALSISVTNSGGDDRGGMAVASWGPG